MPTFGFGEAFCLMWYACECGHRERIWNSRDGITPFSIGCPSCGELMRHVDWRKDRSAPDHEPWPYQRYFRDGTPDDAERIMRRRIETCPTGDAEYDKQLIEFARKGDGEFAQGWPMLDIHLPHELQHSEPGRISEGWSPIDTAPKGGGADLVSDPNWVEPPRLILWFPDERKMVFGYWDWYYAEGGWGCTETGGCAWVGTDSCEPLVLSYGLPTLWRNQPPAPEPEGEKDDG